MSVANRVAGDMAVTGALSVGGGITGQNRAGITTDTLQSYEMPLTDFRVWDAHPTALSTAASDDLGITSAAFGTGLPYITTGDVKALGTTTRRARTTFTFPPEFVDGGTTSIRANAAMVTTVAGTSAVVDFEAYKAGRTAAGFAITGSDLVTTGATSINSLTPAEVTFELNPAALAAGDVLDIRMTITVVDAATGTAVIGAIAHAELLLDIKG